MCKAVKIGKTWKRRGDTLQVRNTRTNAKTKVVWAGQAKREYIDWWKQHAKYDLVFTNVDAFRGRKVEFKLCKNSRIFGILLGQDVEMNGKIIGREGELFLLTRSPRTQTEKNANQRYPVVFTKGHEEVRLFESNDISGACDESTVPGPGENA